jgi:hypothetical protein
MKIDDSLVRSGVADSPQEKGIDRAFSPKSEMPEYAESSDEHFELGAATLALLREPCFKQGICGRTEVRFYLKRLVPMSSKGNSVTDRIRIAALLVCLSSPLLHAQQWTDPTPAELAMTSIPEVPGAPAVYLDKEETTQDALHMFSYYVRLKVLTDRGKDYANVELPYYRDEDGASSQIDAIAGRTIHPDGTIIPFTGKPYDKLVSKAGGIKVKEKVFTLPAVDVGSIIEYRYKFRLDDYYFQSPQWYIQSDLYIRKAHYMWEPTDKDLLDDKGNLTSGSVAWTPILPTGTEVKQIRSPLGGVRMELDVHDIGPLPSEESMPPIHSLSYRVLFYYTPYRTQEEFWKAKGKEWSKDADKFIGPSHDVADYARSLVAAGDTDDQKARKLYAAVETIENTDYTRERTQSEEKSAGLRVAKNTDDILKSKRGSSDQIAMLYVGMARAVGLKAYLMGVASRRERLFLVSYLSLSQIDDDIAIVNIGGKDVYFDPGQRYCEPEHVAWEHGLTQGIRQTDNGTAIAFVPGESYKSARVARIADLKLDEHGEAIGTVTLRFTGDPALRWRHEALKGDETSLKEDLRADLEHMLPGGLDIKVTQIDGLTDFDSPLKVHYEIKGPIGAPTGKRLFVPADLFVSNEKARFTSPKREVAIDLHYASFTQDAVRITFPPEIAIEAAPVPETTKLNGVAAYIINSKRDANSITSFRDVLIGDPIFVPKDYPDVRGFYAKLANKDQETIILTHATAGAVKPSGN